MRTLIPLLLAACTGGTGPDATEAPVDAPTFYVDVAPIYDRACVSCHQEGGIAPFALDTYEEAKAWAAAAGAAVASRTMPPWGAVDDGTCGDHSFRDSRWMDQADIDTIVAWADAGAPEGEVAEREVPEPERLAAGLDLITPTFEAAGTDFLPEDEYRCFLLDPGLAQDTFMTGYEVYPGNDAIVHHIIAMPVGGDALDQIATVDGADGRPGWPCFSGAGEDASGDSIEVTSQAITWTPGQGVVRYPEDYGVRLPAGHQIAVQMHYNLAVDDGSIAPDSTLLRLSTVDDIPFDKELIPALVDEFLQTALDPEPQTLEPGQTDVVVRYNLPWDDDIPFDLDIVGVMPHMHGLGKRMKMQMSMEPDLHMQDVYASDTWGVYDPDCLVRVDDWQYEWQMNYFFEQPVRVPIGTELTITCVYDTTGVTEPVMPGLGTDEEMCLMGFFLAIVL